MNDDWDCGDPNCPHHAAPSPARADVDGLVARLDHYYTDGVIEEAKEGAVWLYAPDVYRLLVGDKAEAPR